MAKHGDFDPDEPGSAPHQDDYEDAATVELVTVVPAEGKIEETARALLEAAGDRPGDVQMSDGNFVVPAALAKSAKVPEAKVVKDTQTSLATPPPAPSKSVGEGNAQTSTSTPAKKAARRPAAKKAAATAK